MSAEGSLLSLYKEAEALEVATDDSEEEPYKSKYAAREIWNKLTDLFQLSSINDASKKLLILWSLYKCGVNLCETEEKGLGAEKLSSILSDLESLEFDCENVLLRLTTSNYLGYVCESRSDHERALFYLAISDKTYSMYSALGDQCIPYDFELLLQRAENPATFQPTAAQIVRLQENFEQSYTQTLYFFAQVHKNLGDFGKAAEYCHTTLVRQMQTSKYNSLDWALNCATLSQYFISKEKCFNFAQARHYLACAESVLGAIETSDDDGDFKEKVQKAKADLYRCWVKFGLALLDVSRDRLLEPEITEKLQLLDLENDGRPVEVKDEEVKSPSNSLLRIPNLASDQFESQILDKFVQNFEDARQVFMQIQRWIKSASQYYTLNEHCSDFVEVMQDQSKAFKFLAFFEPDAGRKCRMHKRRIDLLENLLKPLSMTYYLLLCRQLLFELGETTYEMMDLKLEGTDDDRSQIGAHQAAKVNYLAGQAIDYYEQFLNSYKDRDGNPIAKFLPESVRPVILAHFYIARLYSKMLTGDASEKITHCRKSLDEYSWIVDYCEKTDPECLALVKSEYEVCAEMAKLLPLKMAKLKSFVA